MQLFVIACFTRLKVLRLDLCLLFSGQHDLCLCRKNPESWSSALAPRHQIHIAIISGILMLLQFMAYQMQLPKLLLGKDSLTVAFLIAI